MLSYQRVLSLTNYLLGFDFILSKLCFISLTFIGWREIKSLRLFSNTSTRHRMRFINWHKHCIFSITHKFEGFFSRSRPSSPVRQIKGISKHQGSFKEKTQKKVSLEVMNERFPSKSSSSEFDVVNFFVLFSKVRIVLWLQLHRPANRYFIWAHHSMKEAMTTSHKLWAYHFCRGNDCKSVFKIIKSMFWKSYRWENIVNLQTSNENKTINSCMKSCILIFVVKLLHNCDHSLETRTRFHATLFHGNSENWGGPLT